MQMGIVDMTVTFKTRQAFAVTTVSQCRRNYVFVKVDFIFIASPEDEAKGKKRARKDEQNPGASPSKKPKGDTVAKKPGRVPKVRLPRPPTVNATAKAALKERQKEALVTQPRWQTLRTSAPQKERKETRFTEFRPRLWTGDKEELLGILPEMCGPKCINGISWLLYQNPMMILDGSTHFFETKKVDDFTVDLTTTRSFMCPAAATDFDVSAFDLTPLHKALVDTTMEPIESVPVIVNRASGSSGIGPFDVNGHCNPVVEPHMEGVTPSTMRYTLPCPASQAFRVLAMNLDHTEGDPPIQQADEYGQLIHALRDQEDNVVTWTWIDGLDPSDSSNLVYILAIWIGVVPVPDKPMSDYLRGQAPYLLDLCRKWRATKVKGPNIEELVQNLINNRKSASVGSSNTSDCEHDSRLFGDMLIQGSDTDSNPSPRDALFLPVPSPVPQEIQALIDAYVFGKPLTVIVSNERLFEDWDLHLPEEYGYVLMGFYRIIGVEEYRVQSPGPMSTSPDFVSGRVCWRFRIRWSAGGEECIWQDRNDVLKYAWWSPAQESPAGGPRSAVNLLPIVEHEEFFPTTLRYRMLRKQNREYKYRHDPLQDLYYYIFPTHLLMSFTALLPDANFPRGWICEECGRLNFQRSLRRRKCPSLSCKDSKPVAYFLDLFLLRDPQDRLTLPLPYNTYPEDGVTVRHARWDDGTQTFSCLPDTIGKTFYIKHIFTGNLPRLQSYTKEWLKYIQLELDIVRKPGDNGPYFNYSSDFRRGTDLSTKVPDCILDMKQCMVSRAKLYAQIEGKDLRIDKLDILAWVTSGSKKYPIPIKATKKAVVFLCLGCNITLNVTPLAKRTFPISEADEKEENPQGDGGWLTNGFGDDPMEELTTPSSPKKRMATSKKDKSSFVLSLVHGDILVFFGDEFEYTIKRHGTSFLLMGSCVDAEQDE